MSDTVITTKIKTMAVSPEVHAKFMELKKVLNAESASVLVDKLITEYEENRK